MKILMVDDSDVMRQMMRFTLESTGLHRCVAASDGVQALEALKEQTVDMVITDLNMPNMNGIELITALRAMTEYKYIPIIMLTTEKGEQLQKQGKEAGVSGWLTKPFNPEKLLHIVSKFNSDRASA